MLDLIQHCGLAADRIQATWVGHASVLVQMGGLCFLTDPVFAQRCSPFSFMGPKYVSQVTSIICQGTVDAGTLEAMRTAS